MTMGIPSAKGKGIKENVGKCIFGHNVVSIGLKQQPIKMAIKVFVLREWEDKSQTCRHICKSYIQ